MSGPPPPPPASTSGSPPPAWPSAPPTHTWSALPPAHRGPTIELWPFLGFWLRAGGFVFLFLGTLIAIVGATPGGGCVTSPGSCGTGFLGQAFNSILAAKILWVLGLGALGAGAGIRLHWGIRMPANATADEVAWLLGARRANWVLLVISILLLLALLVWSAAWTSVVPVVP